MEEKMIGILGAGTMGAGMAAVYAAGGYGVKLYSRTEATLEKARTAIEAAVTFLLEEGLARGQREEILARTVYTTSLEEAVRGCFYVSETVAEKAEVKQAVFAELDRLLPPEVLISSNTSYMNVFPFLPEARQPYFSVVHWVAPPHVIPLVEVVKGPGTSEETMARMMRLHEEVGKAPVRMEKFIPGFMLNRLQAAMTREVLGLLSGGYCTPEMLDRTVKNSLMPRGLSLGLTQRMDFNGIDVVAHGLAGGSFVPFGAPPADNPVTRMAERGELGVKSGMGFRAYPDPAAALRERDRQLLQAIRLMQSFPPIGEEREQPPV